jgi:hypothetical protein
MTAESSRIFATGRSVEVVILLVLVLSAALVSPAAGDPLNPQWQTIAPVPMPGRSAATAACARDLCYVMGGLQESANGLIVFDGIWAINATSGESWTTSLPGLTGGPGGFSSSAIVWDPNHPGKYTVWVAGGQGADGPPDSASALTSWFDPELVMWQDAQPLPPMGPPGGQSDFPGFSKHALVAVNSTLVLIGGSYQMDAQDYGVSRKVWAFDADFPSGSSWTEMPLLKLPQETALMGAAALDGVIYVAGGGPCWAEDFCQRPRCVDRVTDDDDKQDDDNMPVKGPYQDVWMLDFASVARSAPRDPSTGRIRWELAQGTWQALNPLQYPRCGLSLLADPVNNFLYAIGGWDNNNVGGITEALNLTQGVAAQWQVVPGFPLALEFAAVASLSVPPGDSVRNHPSWPIGIVAQGLSGSSSGYPLYNQTWVLQRQ